MPAITTRDGLSEYCLRALGAPVLEINVDPDQIEDRIDEALQFYQEFHSDATVRTFLKHQVTQTDLDNGYITVASNIETVSRVFPINGLFASGGNMFGLQYQMMLNDIATFANFAGDMAYYSQMQQYLSLIDMKLNGMPQVQFSRHQHRLYIHGDFKDGDVKLNDYIVAEIYQLVDPETFTSVYNDKFSKQVTLTVETFGVFNVHFYLMC